MIFKEVEYKNSNTKYDWEEIPQEELWEDGEMSKIDVKEEIFWRVITMGDWRLIRRKGK